MFSFKNILLLALYALINTMLSFGVISIINKTISGSQAIGEPGFYIVFFSFVVYLYLLNVGFQKIIIKSTYHYVYDSEISLVEKLQSTSLLQIQQLGAKRIYGVLEDLRMFVFFPNILVNTINSLLLLLLCITYLFVMSFKAALVTMVLLVAIILVHIVISGKTRKQLDTLRSNNDTFNGHIGDILDGFKELKISETRKRNLFGKYVAPNRQYGKGLDIEVANIFLGVNILSQYGVYAILGTILFVIPLLITDLKIGELTSFVVVFLFMAGPINRIIAMQGTYSRLLVAYKRVSRFFRDFNANEPLSDSVTAHPSVDFRSLEFKSVCFSYAEDAFTVGPVDLKIENGETVFIIGGNGSGKSTFINLLTGLLQPTSGHILLNGEEVDTRDTPYRELLSVIFTDNYLFSVNYEDYELKGNEEYNELLKLMRLENVVKNDDDEAARRKFSKGESKRMSMIFALLEKHPVMILDEWAADQDPYFRKYFYEELLPILKKQGKTLIMVTHDDAYFSQADRVLKFDYGKIVDEIKMSSLSPQKPVLWNN
ncbi:MAG: cyclic peptide export ABC transporter [Cyclobacteriaceae bacterium]